MLKFGDKVISNLYFSDKRISKAYMGSKLVYKEREPIFVDYIEFDGESYIDSEYYPSSETAIEVTIEPNAEVGICVLGVGGTNKLSSYLTGYYRFGDTYSTGEDILDVQKGYKRQTIYQDKTGVTLNGVHSSYIAEPTAFTAIEHPSYSIYIGSRNDNGNPSTLAKYIGRMYDIYVYENGTLVRHYKPCINPVGVACMYDIFTKKYYYNKGTGKLIAGPHLLDYIKFDGKSWIDTGITELGGTWTVTASGDDSTQLRFLIGNGGQAANYYGALSNGKWGLGTASEEYYFENARTSKTTAEVIFEESQATATVDGVTSVRPGTKVIGNFLLCGYQSLDNSAYLFKGDVYHCSYVDTTGKLILDLYPAIDTSGVVCMFDKVSHTYYYNQGSGEIKAGGRFVEYIEFDGNSYIDTGIAYQTCTVKTAVKYEANKGQRMLSGFSGTGAYWGMTTQGLLELNSKSGANTNLTDYTEVEFKVNATSTTLYGKADGVEVETSTVSTTDTYTIGCTQSSSFNKIVGNVYYSTFYNATDELIQALRPYLDENGIPCFKDLVTNVKFYNIGTGTFKYL